MFLRRRFRSRLASTLAQPFVLGPCLGFLLTLGSGAQAFALRSMIPDQTDTSARAAELQSRTPDEEAELGRLLAIIRDNKLRESSPETVVRAIDRLGELKPVSAIDDLVGLLGFKDPSRESKHPYLRLRISPFRQPYPAVSALLEIGKPALPALVKAVETHEPGSVTSENAIYIIVWVNPEDPAAGVHYLQNAADKATSRVAAYRLSLATTRAGALIPQP